MKNCTLPQYLLLSIIICFASISTAQSNNFDHLKDAQDAFNLGFRHQAFEIWHGQAITGDADAQMFVGLAYRNGWGVAKDLKHAIIWYMLSAEQQNTSAQFLLGLALLESNEDEDISSGVNWLQLAAENGDSKARQFLSKAKLKNWFTVADTLPVHIQKKETTKAPSSTVPAKHQSPVTLSSTNTKPTLSYNNAVLN